MTRSRWAWAVLGAAVAAGGVAAWRLTRPPAAPGRPVVVVVSGDTAGWLVPCGCTANQSGGLPRRATYLGQLGDEADVLYADAGGAAAGTSEYHRIKFEAVLRGELAMGLAAHNVGGPEAALGGDYLRRVAQELNVPFVSANVRDPAGPITEPVRVVERGGLRLAITGVLSPRSAPRGLTVEDPREAVLRVVGQVKGRADRLVVLAYLPADELRALAAGLPEADAVVGGPTGQAVAPQAAGSATFAAATNKGKFLVRLNGWRERALAGEVVELTPAYADDPDQQANVRRYLGDLGARDIPAADSGLAPPLPSRPPAGYRIAGTATCQPCHGKDCAAWAASGHAHAWRTLADRGYHVDPYCQQCHTTGFGLPGGFESAGRAGQAHSVGCESCHGPSQAHVKNPKVRTTFAARDQCATCHDRENSPTFAYDTFWPKVRHGEPATPPQGGTQ